MIETIESMIICMLVTPATSYINNKNNIIKNYIYVTINVELYNEYNQ